MLFKRKKSASKQGPKIQPPTAEPYEDEPKTELESEIASTYLIEDYRRDQQKKLDEILELISRSKVPKSLDQLEIKVSVLHETLFNPEKGHFELIKKLAEIIEFLNTHQEKIPEGTYHGAKDELQKGITHTAEEILRRLARAAESPFSETQYFLGLILEERMELQDAFEIYSKAVSQDGENPKYLLAAGRLARKIGMLDESKVWLEKLVRLVSGDDTDNLGLANAQNQLGLLYYIRGNYSKAKFLFQHAFDTRNKVLGPDHLDTAAVLSNMAELHLDLQETEEAERLFHQIETIYQSRLPEDHPLLGRTSTVLAEFHHGKGEVEKAEKLYQQALVIYRKNWGEDHPEVATALNDLALAVFHQHRYKEAEDMYNQALDIYRKRLGADHLFLSKTQFNLAELFYHQGDHDQAMALYQSALKIKEQRLGEDHIDLTQTLSGLGEIYRAKGGDSLAQKCFERAFQIAQNQLEETHPYIAFLSNQLAGFYRSRSEFEKAKEYYELSVKIATKNLGEDHPTRATYLGNLAGLYQSLRQYEQSEQLFLEALDIFKRSQGKKHPDVGFCLFDLGMLYEEQKNYDKAENVLVEALKIFEKKFPGGHTYLDLIERNLDEVRRKSKGN